MTSSLQNKVGFNSRLFNFFIGQTYHQDSVGNCGTLSAGWCQWMTAGSGVVHSEMPSAEFLKTGGRVEGFQLWVNLPKKYKMVSPRYQDTPPERIPVVRSPGILFTTVYFLCKPWEID